jgi:branched-chain amino acid transport system permease protein
MNRSAARASFLLAILLLALFPLIGDKYELQLVSKIMLMAIFAMSLDLLVGFTGLVSLGHAAFFGLGGYVLWLLSPQYAAASLWLSLAVVLLTSAVAALLIGALVLRSSGVYFIMVTLAFAQMFYYYTTGAKWLGGSDGAYIYVRPSAALFGWTPFNLGSYVQFYYVALILMAAIFLLLRVVLRSLFGSVIRGVKSNENRLRSLGYPTFRYKLVSFVIAGAIAGLAGYFNAAQFGFVNPELFGWRLSGEVLMMVILGGMGTLYGPVLGAFVLVLLESELAATSKHWLLPMGLFVICAVLLLPQGIAGLIRRFSPLRAAKDADA